MINRIICAWFGHSRYMTYKSVTSLIPKELFKDNAWEFQVIECSRCEEVHLAYKFPIFVEAKSKITERMVTLDKLGINKSTEE